MSVNHGRRKVLGMDVPQGLHEPGGRRAKPGGRKWWGRLMRALCKPWCVDGEKEWKKKEVDGGGDYQSLGKTVDNTDLLFKWKVAEYIHPKSSNRAVYKSHWVTSRKDLRKFCRQICLCRDAGYRKPKCGQRRKVFEWPQTAVDIQLCVNETAQSLKHPCRLGFYVCGILIIIQK